MEKFKLYYDTHNKKYILLDPVNFETPTVSCEAMGFAKVMIAKDISTEYIEQWKAYDCVSCKDELLEVSYNDNDIIANKVEQLRAEVIKEKYSSPRLTSILVRDYIYYRIKDHIMHTEKSSTQEAKPLYEESNIVKLTNQIKDYIQKSYDCGYVEGCEDTKLSMKKAQDDNTSVWEHLKKLAIESREIDRVRMFSMSKLDDIITLFSVDEIIKRMDNYYSNQEKDDEPKHHIGIGDIVSLYNTYHGLCYISDMPTKNNQKLFIVRSIIDADDIAFITDHTSNMHYQGKSIVINEAKELEKNKATFPEYYE